MLSHFNEYLYLNVLWFSLGLIEMLFLLRLYLRRYGRPSVRIWKIATFMLLTFMVVTLIYREMVEPHHPVALSAVNVLCSLVVLPFFRQANYRKKILFGLLLFAVASFWILTYDLIITPLPKKNFLLVEVMCHIIFWLLLELIGRYGNRKRQVIPFSWWFLLMLISAASIFIYFLIFHYIITSETPYVTTIEIPVMLVLMFINLSLFVLFDRFAEFTYADRERLLLRQQLGMQYEHYKKTEHIYGRMRTMHHDMRNHLQAASRLVRQEEHQELDEYLQQAVLQLSSYEQMAASGNPILDSILNMKAEELLQEGIRIKLDLHVPPSLKLTFEQGVTIFGNLLDNAKEACLKLPPEERWVDITLSYINATLMIAIANSANGTAAFQRGGMPVTQKSDKENHGLGIKNVRRAIEKNGTMQIESQPDCFRVEIALYDL